MKIKKQIIILILQKFMTLIENYFILLLLYKVFNNQILIALIKSQKIFMHNQLTISASNLLILSAIQ